MIKVCYGHGMSLAPIGYKVLQGESCMKNPGVLVVAGNSGPGYEVCSLLQELDYTATLFHSLNDLLQELRKDSGVAVILDLDSVPVNNQFLRGLRKEHPQLDILGISQLSYHPGLEEVIGSHLLACLVKPLDAEELCFWLKSISEHLANPVKEAEG
jgi:DNA-binding NtrC family response regulator